MYESANFITSLFTWLILSVTNISTIFLGEKQYFHVLIFTSLITSENNIVPLFCLREIPYLVGISNWFFCSQGRQVK